MLKVVILGVGSRGANGYGKYALLHPDKLQVAAICDIDKNKLKKYSEIFSVPEDKCFADSEKLFAAGKLADAIFICTQDRNHFSHAMQALRLGYDILLEKPISPVPQECLRLAAEAKKFGRKIVVCHVLRYTAYFRKIKELIESGRIGKVIGIEQIENVEYWHQCHSFVRGNWRNSDQTSPMILQKCCHDFDILYWLSGAGCESLSSYGDLHWFRKENAPQGAAQRCLDGCAAKDECPFDAEKIYIDEFKRLRLSDEEKKTAFPYSQLCLDPTVENLYKAIQKGPYGRCVYHCDNNVVDHQIVSMLMNNGVKCTLTMSAFTKGGGRIVKVMGTLGEVIGDEYANEIRVGVYGKETEVIDVRKLTDDLSGHSGGDNQLVCDFIDMIEKGTASICGSTIEHSIESPMMAFAAEYSRLHGGEKVKMKDFIHENIGEL